MAKSMLLEDVLRTIPQRQSKQILLEDVMKLDSPDVEKAKKRGFGEQVKYFLGEGIIKPIAVGIELIPSGAEKVIQVGLDNLRERAKKELAKEGVIFGISEKDYLNRTPLQKKSIAVNTKIVENLDRAMDTSKRLQQWWIEKAFTGVEAPDIELMKKSAVPFTKDYSAIRMLALGFQSAPMLGLAAAVSFATKSPTAGAAVIGITEAAEEFGIAREKGKAIGEANFIFAIDTVMLSALETIPMTSFMKGGKLPIRMFRGAIQEGSEEVLQGLWRDSVAKLDYDKTRSLTEGLVEEFIVGFISGGTIGGFSKGVTQKINIAKEKGVNIDAMREAISEQIINNADEITESFLEKPLKPISRPQLKGEVVEVKPTEQPTEQIEQIDKAIKMGDEQKLLTFDNALVRKRKMTLIKQSIKDINKGIKEGKRLTKEEIKTNQEEIINLLNLSELEAKDKAKFISTIKNIQNTEQLEKSYLGIQERIVEMEETAEKASLVKKITRFAEIKKIDADYKDKINDILEQYDLKKRTAKTKAIREKRAAFFDRQIKEGNLDFIPKDYFDNIGKKTLDEMSLDEVENLYNQIQILATVGTTKNRLLSARAEKDFQKALNVIIEKSYKKFGKTEKGIPQKDILTTPHKTTIQNVKKHISELAAAHRKVEFILRTLGVNEEIFELIQAGKNEKLLKTEKVYEELQKTFTSLKESYQDMILKEYNIKGVSFPLTKETAIGIALNNGNQGNRDRLLTKLTPEQIDLIINDLYKRDPKAKDFVSGVFEILDSLFPDIAKTSKALLGINPKKVEGNYFPIYADKELSKLAKYREAETDLFQEMFDVTFIPRGFINKRVGGKAPIDLNVFDVIFKHIDSVIHFNTMAIPVRDVQKITNNPRFVKMVTDLMGEEVYNQIPQWLRKIANPNEMKAKGTLDVTSQCLRHNATTAILGHRIVTSMLQGGSITLAINELGAPAVAKGIAKFWSDKKGMKEWVYSLSPSMKYRRSQIDREMRDWLKTKKALKITKGKKSWEENLFCLITAVDYLTIMPSWITAYDVRFAETNDIALSVQYADMINRVTQPQAAIENMAAIMSGTPTQKLFTSFMTFFSVFHNQFVAALDKAKYSQEVKTRKIRDFSRTMAWIWILPAVLAGFIRSGFRFDPKKMLQEIATYPFAGIIFMRDLANMIFKGFDIGAPPGLAGFKEAGYAAKTKNIGLKIKHGLKAIGLLTGKIPLQWIDSLAGFIDLINKETEDIRRLYLSKYALKPSKKKDEGTYR